MELVELVNIGGRRNIGIYHLSYEAAKKHGKEFLLARDGYCDMWLKAHTDEEIIARIRKCYNEGLFETHKEAYLTAKLIAATSELSRLKGEIDRLRTLTVNEVKW